jgi:hypothetical protein
MKRLLHVAENNFQKNFSKATQVERELRVLFPKLCVDLIYDERAIGDWRKLIYRMLPRLVPSI